MDEDAEGVGDEVGVPVAPPVQAVPLTAKLDGAGLLPVQEPLNPNATPAPVAMLAYLAPSAGPPSAARPRPAGQAKGL